MKWSHVKSFNPAGGGYPEATRGYVLKSEADNRIAELEAEVDRVRLNYGRQQARCAVFMAALAREARNGQQEWAQSLLKAADAAAASVRLEDFVVARPASFTKEDAL